MAVHVVSHGRRRISRRPSNRKLPEDGRRLRQHRHHPHPWAYDTTGTRHDRDITTDHGWKIVLSRGLDVFQRLELNEVPKLVNRSSTDSVQGVQRDLWLA